MTGLGVGVVFLILVTLIFILEGFSKVLAEGNKARRKSKQQTVTPDDFKGQVDGYDEDMAAVATAVYLYLDSAHDEESGLLTIHQDEHSLWHAQLNEKI